MEAPSTSTNPSVKGTASARRNQAGAFGWIGISSDVRSSGIGSGTLQSGEDRPHELAETDARGAGAGPAPQHHLVAVLEERAPLARWQADRLGASPRQLHEAAGLGPVVGAREGAAGEEV